MSIVTSITEWLLARVKPNIFELGSSRFRRVKGLYKNDSFTLGETDYVTSPDDMVFSNRLEQAVYDHESVVSSIQELFHRKRFNENYVSIVIPDQAFLLGSFSVPNVALKAGFKPLLEREVQKNATLSFKDYEIRFEPGQKVGKKTIIHYCAIPKGVIADIEVVCLESGLVPLSFQPSFTGLLKLARITAEPNYTYSLLHLGNEAITATIYSADGLRQIQVLEMGMFDLIRSIEKAMNINFEEAKKMLEEEIVLLDDPASDAQFDVELYKILEPVFAEILKKIYGFLLLYTNDHPEENGFAKILLSGGGSRIKNIDKLIFSNLGINTGFIGAEVSKVISVNLLPVTETFESLAPILGNILIEPWNINGYDRVMTA